MEINVNIEAEMDEFMRSYRIFQVVVIVLVVFGMTQVAPAKEDCVSFNPARTQVKRVQNSLKIVDGSHWMFDFGKKKNEAYESLKIIKKYGFTHSCFVGRTKASLKYLRR